MKAEQNKVSKSIPQLKKAGEDVSAVLAQMKELSQEVKALDAEQAEVEQQLHDTLLTIPNVPADKVPEGADDTCNPELRRWSEPRAFDFEPKAHWDIGKDLGILDPDTAAKVTGSRFHFYKGMGARLERAVINYFLNTHTDNGYTEILPPFMANTASMTGTGQLPKFEEDAYRIHGSDEFLIPTAEVPLTNIHAGEVLDEADLPRAYCAATPCFRSEAGAAGKDTRGLIRLHQFTKVEMVRFAHPDDSFNQLEIMVGHARTLLEKLELPYRVITLCTGDMGFGSAKTYDLEVWLPAQNTYREISSCSNCIDFQARRADIRFKPKGGKSTYCHTLNGSGLPTGRAMAAILENGQQKDGSIVLPKALVPYMDGVEVIEPAGKK